MRIKVKTGNVEIQPIKVTARLIKGPAEGYRVGIESHIHSECEIYVNLEGDVSFMVESRIYRVKSGDVIITRPNEAHHCIVHNNNIHNHFCITFSGECKDEILEKFFEREVGNENLISLSDACKEKLINLCYILVDENTSLKKHIAFFNLIELLSEEKSAVTANTLPDDVDYSIEYINKNLSRQITVGEVAQCVHVTVNTLERHFKKFVGISPYKYIQNCRLDLAVSILEKGGTVTRAAEDSGFPDYSHFIALFKKTYGKTPRQFQKGL